MKVNVGSQNKGKIKAVNVALSHYFDDLNVNGVEVDSEVHNQPKTIQEIVKGAKNRAIAAFKHGNCELGIGIESGIFKFPETHSGYVDTSCTVIFDGKEFFVGSSPCFEYPKKVIDAILNDGKEVCKIFNELGWGDEGFHQREGAIGVLTKGVITREKYSEFSVIMALTRYLNKELYK